MITLFFWKWKRRNIQKFQNEGKAKVMGGVENLINNARSQHERERKRAREREREREIGRGRERRSE